MLLDLPLSLRYFLSLFDRANIQPRIVMGTAAPDALRSYVGSGFGFSLMTARPLNRSAENGKPLAYVPLEGDYPKMVIGLACLKDMRRTRIVDVFAEHCAKLITTDNIPGMEPI